MRYERVEDIVRQWLEPAFKQVGIDNLIYARQDAPQPRGDYAVIDIIGLENVKPVEVRYIDLASIPDNPQVEEQGLFRADIRVAVRLLATNNAMSRLSEVTARARLSSSCDVLFAYGVGLSYLTPVMDRSFIESDAKYRYRADFEAILSFGEIHAETLQTIGTVEISGEVDSGFKGYVEVSDGIYPPVIKKKYLITYKLNPLVFNGQRLTIEKET